MTNDLCVRLQKAIGLEYEVGSELGGGVQSRVFLARDTELDRKVVIKVLPPELAAGDGIERFRREIKLVAGLQHPHIVPLLIAGEADGLLYYTMPFVTGDSLRTRIERDGPQDIDLVVNVLAEVSSALAYAHGRGIVHRDVKPENIFIEAESGRALLADFGVARRIGFEGALTGGGVAVGTPAYMSPEHIDGGPVDGRSDIYSLGLVGWELLAGERPWHGETLYALIFNQKYEPVPALSDRRQDVPQRLWIAIERALEKDADARWESAEAMLSYICNESSEAPRLVRRRASVAAPPVSGPPGQPPPAPRRTPIPRTITAGKLEVRWAGEFPMVISPALRSDASRWMATARVVAGGCVVKGRQAAGSTAQAGRHVASATAEAGRQVAGVTAQAGRQVAGVTAQAGRQVAGVTAQAGRQLAAVAADRGRRIARSRATVPTAILACLLVLGGGLRWAGASARVPIVPAVAPAVAAPRAPEPDEDPTLPAVAASWVAPTLVTPAVSHLANDRLDRVFGTLVGAFTPAGGGGSAVRELRRAEAVWENGRRRTCARLDDDHARARCSERLAALRAEELSELLARARMHGEDAGR